MKTKGLTLAEAHASGRKYKRPLWDRYARLVDKTVFLPDAIATDYELEPEAKLLTREDVKAAIYLALRGKIGPSYHDRCLEEVVTDKLFGPEDV